MCDILFYGCSAIYWTNTLGLNIKILSKLVPWFKSKNTVINIFMT